MNQNKENTVFNVLSCFDGMSCGQVALQRAGIAYENYFASEVDKYAIQITQKNHPNTIQLGTIENWKEWNLPKIDLLIGGSPCQGFSNAGLGLNFDDPRSKLFFTYVDILNDLRSKNPELLFLLENVRMKKEWRDIITEYMGVEPVEINSSLVSAQNRKRLYWTNIPDIEQPEDRFIYLKDILEDGDVDRQKDFCLDASYAKGGNPKRYFEKGSRQLVFGAALRNQVTKRGVEAQLNVRKDEKSNCVVPSYPHKLNGVVVGVAMRGRYDENGKIVQQLEFNGTEKSNALTSVQKDSLIFVGGLEKGRRLDDGKSLSRNFREGSRIYSVEGKFPTLSAQPKGGEGGYTGLIQVGMASDVNGLDCVKRVYSMFGKSPTLTDMQGGQRQPKVLVRRNGHGFVPTEIKFVEKSDTLREATQHNYHIRKKSKTVRVGTSNSPAGSKQEWDLVSKEDYRRLTVIECERLQTLEDNYTEGVSNTQRYKMIGNGWTVDVIAHIFRNIRVAEPND